jgi:hypothetical protein
VDKKANDTFAFDLENRLDDFFSDSMPSQEDAPADEPQTSISELPLKDLKSTILAIDWEITDDALEAFIHQVDNLNERFEDDKAIQTLLKLLKSLGRYLRAHKSKAHPDTIKRIMAVYSALEKSVYSEELGQNEKEKIVLEEVKLFQELKSKIVASKTAYPADAHPQPVSSGDLSGHDAVIKAIEDLRQMISDELTAIRGELEHLRKK